MNWIIEIKTKFEPSQVKDDKKVKLVAAVPLVMVAFLEDMFDRCMEVHILVGKSVNLSCKEAKNFRFRHIPSIAY